MIKKITIILLFLSRVLADEDSGFWSYTISKVTVDEKTGAPIVEGTIKVLFKDDESFFSEPKFVVDNKINDKLDSNRLIFVDDSVRAVFSKDHYIVPFKFNAVSEHEFMIKNKYFGYDFSFGELN